MENTGINNNSGTLLGNYRAQMYYEDTDFSGYVYHANFLKYFERAREHVFGSNYLKTLFEQNFHFVVAKADITFKRPASFGDILEIKSTAPFDGSPIIDFKQEAFLVDTVTNQTHEKAIVSADIRLVSIDRNGKPIRIPEAVMNHLLTLSQQVEHLK